MILNDIQKEIISILTIIGIFAAGLFIGRFYFSKTEIKIKERIVYTTVYTEKIPPIFDQNNFDKLLKCYNSDLQFKDRTESNYLFVTAFDSCKEATARYEIGTKGDWKIYTGVGVAGIITGGILYYKYGR